MKDEAISPVSGEACSTGGTETMKRRTGGASQKTVLTVGGDLSVQRASELKNVLRSSLENGEHLVLEFAECSGTDLSFVQLLCSAHRTAVGLGKSLELGASASTQFLRMVDEAGYLRDKCCAFSGDKSCLWLRRSRGGREHEE
jgi:ABC-type transporter Mla MlaB component